MVHSGNLAGLANRYDAAFTKEPLSRHQALKQARFDPVLCLVLGSESCLACPARLPLPLHPFSPSQHQSLHCHLRNHPIPRILIHPPLHPQKNNEHHNLVRPTHISKQPKEPPLRRHTALRLEPPTTASSVGQPASTASRHPPHCTFQTT